MLARLKHLAETFSERLLHGFVWNAFGAVSVQGASLIATALLLHLLGLESFGAYQLIISTLFMIANFAQGGCAFVATKLVAENLERDRIAVASTLHFFSKVTFFSALVATILVLCTAPLISGYILERPELNDGIYLAAASVFFQVAFTYRMGALQGFSAFRELGTASAISGVASVAIIYVAALWHGLEGALIGYALSNALRSLLCAVALRKVEGRYSIPAAAPRSAGGFRHLWYLSLPAALAGLITLPALWTVNISISKLPDGLALVGILAVAHQIRQAVLYVPMLLNNVSFAAMSRLLGSGTRQAARSVFYTNLTINIGFATLVSLALFVIASPIMSAYSLERHGADEILRILALSIVPELAAISVYQLVQSSGLLWRSLFQIAIPRDLTLLVLSIVTLPHYGLMGAAASYLVAHILGFLATLLTARPAFYRINGNG